MRVALACDAAYPFTRGGRETRYYEIARRLVKNGHRVHYFSFKWWDGPAVQVRDGIVYHGVAPVRFHRFVEGRRSVIEALHFAVTLPFALLGQRFDLIDCDEIPYLHIPLVRLIAWCRRMPLVTGWWECWDTYWYRYLGALGHVGRLVERAAARMPDWLVVETESNRDTLTHWGVPGSRIAVIPSGVDFPRVGRVAPSQEVHDVIFVGRLVRTKGPYTLIEALSCLRRSGRSVTAAIVGDGPERDALRRRAEESGLDGLLRFYGRLDSNDDVYALMKASKLSVYPVAMEGGWALSAMEAQACGLPVVTFAEGALGRCELVRDGYNGVLVSEDAGARGLAEAIWRLLSDDAQRSSMRTHAFEFARLMDWDQIASTTEHLYTKIAQGMLRR